MNPSRLLLLLPALGLLLAAVPAGAEDSSYETPLPAQLSTDPDLCAHAPCRDVVPGADSFSHRKGRPSYVEAYRSEAGRKELIGYAFLSTDIVDIPAYSGKPVVTLLGMDLRGIITGVKILRHSEPIMLVGIPEAELTKFTLQYVGKFVGDKIEIGTPRPGEALNRTWRRTCWLRPRACSLPVSVSESAPSARGSVSPWPPAAPWPGSPATRR